MKTEISNLLSRYEDKLLDSGANFIKSEDLESTPNNSLNQALWMICEMRRFGTAMSSDKFNRWLGFVHGILFMNNLYTISELRNQTREIKDLIIDENLRND